MFSFHSSPVRMPAHKMPPAGARGDQGHITAADCLQAPGAPACPTSTYQQQCSTAAAQQGAAEAAAAAAAGARPTPAGEGREGVAQCLHPTPNTFQQQLQAAQEANYHRSKLEPLGRPRQRGAAPTAALDAERAFGVALNARELEKTNQGKLAIYGGGGGSRQHDSRQGGGQGGQEGGDATVHALYVKTHRDFAPGEQRKWGYDFKGAEPAEVRFGKPPCPNTGAELKAALQPGGAVDDLGALPERLQRFALKNRDLLGMPRSPNALERDLPPDLAYGRKAGKEDWGADRILRGSYSPTQQLPDANLGKPASPGCRAPRGLPREDSLQQQQQGQQQQGQQGQQGQQVAADVTPRVAAPLPPQKTPTGAGWAVWSNAAASPSLLAGAGGASGRARAGQQQASITQLLRPIDTVYQGVTEDHFRQPRSREEMWELVSASGVVKEPAAFMRIYQQACRHNSGCCSLEGFINAKMQMVKAGGPMELPPLR